MKLKLECNCQDYSFWYFSSSLCFFKINLRFSKFIGQFFWHSRIYCPPDLLSVYIQIVQVFLYLLYNSYCYKDFVHYFQIAPIFHVGQIFKQELTSLVSTIRNFPKKYTCESPSACINSFRFLAALLFHGKPCLTGYSCLATSPFFISRTGFFLHSDLLETTQTTMSTSYYLRESVVPSLCVFWNPSPSPVPHLRIFRLY